MRFAVIEGDLGWGDANGRSVHSRPVTIGIEDVEAEARRRLRAIKLDEWRTREFITGRPMPEDVKHFALQVEFAAKAISRLSPIPGDFDSDVYWPHMWDQ